ncbi:MAG TPA: copper resistance protein CopC [Dehalococcoidia bacterium]|nr:copper resistance protein CopC [Dehalococcoidia bacterium]
MKKQIAGYFVFAVAALCALATVETASAHAEPESADPPIGGTVAEVPTEVEVTFSQEVVRQGQDSSITVIDAAGGNVTSAPSEVDDLDRTIIRVGLQPELPNGVYTVQWQTVSAADGDTASGSFVFTIDATPAATATEAETPAVEETEEEPSDATAEETPAAVEEADDDDGVPTWVIALGVVGIIVVVGLGVGAFIFVRNE